MTNRDRNGRLSWNDRKPHRNANATKWCCYIGAAHDALLKHGERVDG